MRGVYCNGDDSVDVAMNNEEWTVFVGMYENHRSPDLCSKTTLRP